MNYMRSFLIRGSTAVALTVLFAVATPTSVLAGPREELLQLVPDDVSFCFVLNNLRDHSAKLQTSKTIKQLRKSVIFQALIASNESQQFFQQFEQVQKQLGIGWKQIQDDVLGDCVVFGFQYNPEAKKERGLVLVWARDAGLLKRLVAKVNALQLQSKELKGIDNIRYKGATYHRRTEAGGKVEYYFQRKSLFVFANDETLIKHVVDRTSVKAATPSAVLKRFDSVASAESVLTLWLNPRSFDADLKKKIAAAEGDERQVLTTLGQFWKALDALAVGLSVQPELEVSLSIHGEAQRLPTSARRIFSFDAAAGDLAARFPKNAVVAVSGRINVAAVFETLELFMTPENRAKFQALAQNTLGAPNGLDFRKDILPHIGPDFGMFFSEGSKTNQVAEGLLALRVSPGKKDAQIDEMLFGMVRAGAQFGVTAHNIQAQTPIVIRHQRGKKLFFLAHRQFPKGFQPTCGLKDGYILLATSPEVVARFTKQPNAKKNAPALRVSFPHLVKLLRRHEDDLVRMATQKNQADSELVRTQIRQFVNHLQLFESLEFDQHVAKSGVRWRLRLIGRSRK